MKKKIRYIIEAGFLYFFYYLFKAMPLQTASNLGAWFGRNVGYKMGATRKALRNISIAFPEKSDDEKDRIAFDMWQNLGRIFAEYPHLKTLEKNKCITIKGLENLEAVEALNKPIIFMTAHFGNWEILPFVINQRIETPLALVYRAPNNPWADNLIQKARGKATKAQLNKGSKGAKEIVKIIRQGDHVGMLVDQKMNEGLPLPFFGRLAMTVTSVAQLALKYDAVVLPAYCVRKEGANFDVIFEKPMDMISTGETHKDIEANMRRVNEKIEEWIRKHPSQWLWLHRRWPKQADTLKDEADAL